MDSLDALMEQKDLDELSESDEEVPQHASVHNYAHAALAVQVAGGGAAQQERSASHAGEKVNDAGGGRGLHAEQEGSPRPETRALLAYCQSS